MQISFQKVFYGALFLSSSLGQAVTNGVPHEIPGIVKLSNSTKGGHCTGSIIGDNPIKVSTALHCIDDYETGGLSMIIPAKAAPGLFEGLFNLLGGLNLVKESMSKKLYMSPNPLLKEAIAQKIVLDEDVKQKTKALEELAGEMIFLRNNAPDPTVLTTVSEEELKELQSVHSKALAKNMEEGQRATMELIAAEAKAYEHGMSVTTRFMSDEMVVVVFDESLPGSSSVQDRVSKFEIIPLARNTSEISSTDVIVGGYGVKAMSGRQSSNTDKYFSTNTIQAHERAQDLFIVYGYEGSDAEKFQIPLGSSGAPLVGDSGGPALTPYGMVGITSMIHSYADKKPPKEGWKNQYEENHPFQLYSYIQAIYPSTSSATAKEILARVESEVGPVTYADQDLGYEEVFYSRLTDLQNTVPQTTPTLQLEIAPTLSMREP